MGRVSYANELTVQTQRGLVPIIYFLGRHSEEGNSPTLANNNGHTLLNQAG